MYGLRGRASIHLTQPIPFIAISMCYTYSMAGPQSVQSLAIVTFSMTQMQWLKVQSNCYVPKNPSFIKMWFICYLIKGLVRETVCNLAHLVGAACGESASLQPLSLTVPLWVQ